MATVWLTYAWDDNKDGDVDFIAQELEAGGVKVNLDRWNIAAGKRLWEQIEEFIVSPEQCDGWVLIATDNSLLSEPCKEEFAYALGRALDKRGKGFPVIGLFIGPVDETLIPAAIRSRLYVSVTDPDWKERIKAAAEGKTPAVGRPHVEPFHVGVHRGLPGNKPIAIEVRPRAGVWAPFFAAVPVAESDRVDPNIMVGPRGVPTNTGMLVNTGSGTNGNWHFMIAGNQATPTQSYFVWCKEKPSKLAFGVNGGPPQFVVEIT